MLPFACVAASPVTGGGSAHKTDKRARCQRLRTASFRHRYDRDGDILRVRGIRSASGGASASSSLRVVTRVRAARCADERPSDYRSSLRITPVPWLLARNAPEAPDRFRKNTSSHSNFLSQYAPLIAPLRRIKYADPGSSSAEARKRS